jgi:hypothetical protein
VNFLRRPSRLNFDAQHVAEQPARCVAIWPPQHRPIARALLRRAGLLWVDQFDGPPIRAEQCRRVIRHRQDRDPSRCTHHLRRARFGVGGRRHHRGGASELAGELRYSLAEIEIVGTCDKCDGVAMRAAAKAMEKPPVGDDVKGRRPLGMEWAQPDIFPPAPHQLDPAADQRCQRGAPAQLVEQGGRIAHFC